MKYTYAIMMLMAIASFSMNGMNGMSDGGELLTAAPAMMTQEEIDQAFVQLCESEDYSEKNSDEVKDLLKKGANVYAMSDRGLAAIAYINKHENKGIADLVIWGDFNVQRAEQISRCSLVDNIPVCWKNQPLMTKLIKQGANIQNAAKQAIRRRDLDKIKILVDGNAQFEVSYPLMNGPIKTLREALEQMIQEDINKDFVLACKSEDDSKQNREKVWALLKKGVNVYVPTPRTDEDHAWQQMPAAAAYINKHGIAALFDLPNFNIKKAEADSRCSLLEVIPACWKNQALLSALVKLGADPAPVAQDAARKRDVNKIRMLIASGADLTEVLYSDLQTTLSRTGPQKTILKEMKDDIAAYEAKSAFKRTFHFNIDKTRGIAQLLEDQQKALQALPQPADAINASVHEEKNEEYAEEEYA